MSPSTAVLAVVASFGLVLLAMSAVAYRRRHGTLVPTSPDGPYYTRRVGRSEQTVGLQMVAALVAGIFAPDLAPDSAFARWLAEPYARGVYLVWCFLAATIVNAVMAARRRLAARGGVRT